MDISSSVKILEALRLMERLLGVVSTVNEKGGPDSAVVYFHFDKNINIYFMSQVDNRKYKNILKNPNVAFVTYSEHPAKTIQMEGVATPITDKSEKEACLELLKETATESCPLPPIHQIKEILSGSDIAVIKITPSWARLGDFDIYRSNKTFYEAEFNK